MIFSTIVILLILAIAFFHYLQGFLSATLSAICAIIAAALALSLHEPLVGWLLRGKFADQSWRMPLRRVQPRRLRELPSFRVMVLRPMPSSLAASTR